MKDKYGEDTAIADEDESSSESDDSDAELLTADVEVCLTLNRPNETQLLG